MYYIEDENFARQLQTELQAFENFKRQKENTEKENLNPIDSKLEYIDPTPSIHDLFVKFDKKFFWNSLGMVQVLWSNKMTKCAGMCSFEGGRGLCKISLSAPLLSLRPRKDLVETLLHEMIHAYLFVTHNYKDREDHGPEFHKHMYRINAEAGTKISVYHTFYDEVEYYQRHIWRCNGPCQNKKPYFGFVKRAVNRKPGPQDTWWSQHQSECGGVFIKISEPEVKNKNIKKTKVVKPVGKHKDIRDYFTDSSTFGRSTESQNNKSSNIKTFADFKSNNQSGRTKSNTGTGTIVVVNRTKGINSKIKNQGNLNSVESNSKFPVVKKSSDAKVVTADKLNTNLSGESKDFVKDSDNDKVRETVRNFWANKFSNVKSPKKSPPSVPSPKNIKLECPVCNEGFSQEEIQNHIDVCLENQRKLEDVKPESSSSKKIEEMKKCPVCSENILHSNMNDHLENCLNCTFVNENDSESDFDKEIVCESVPCPCCYKWFKESEMNVHIDDCLTLNTLKEEILLS